METTALASWKSIADGAAWTFAALAAVAAGLGWFAGRELQWRHATDETELRGRIARSEAVNRATP